MKLTFHAVMGAIALFTASGLATTALAGTDAVRATAAQRQKAAAGAPVLPAAAKPFGYSLADMASLTAAFNVGDRSGPPPNSPFQILYVNGVTNNTTFDVRRGTFLYVPIVYSDNSAPILGDFPASAEDRRQLVNYWYSQQQIGFVTTAVIVNGVTVATGAPYVQGVRLSSPLPNGATQYIAAAAYVAPLPSGSHTVEVRGKATGDALRKPPFDEIFPDGTFEFSISYKVNVR